MMWYDIEIAGKKEEERRLKEGCVALRFLFYSP